MFAELHWCTWLNISLKKLQLIFSTPEPKAHWWAYSIGMPPSSVVHRCQHFQTSSPLKPLGQLKPNFIWSLHGLGERKFVQMVVVTSPRWPPCPYMLKTFKSLLLQNRMAEIIEVWYTASTKLVQMKTPDWPLTFLLKGQIWFLMLFYRKAPKQGISQNLLQSMM